MKSAGRFAFLTACVVLAIALNLVVCRWGINRTNTIVLTLSTQYVIDREAPRIEIAGLFAAPWLEGKPLLATALGILVPMSLIGLGTYVAIRGDSEPK